MLFLAISKTELLGLILPVFALMAIGVVARKTSILSSEGDRTLLNLTLSILVPCLIFDAILGNEAVRTFRQLLIPASAGFAMLVIGFAVCSLVGWLFLRHDPVKARTFGFAGGIRNYSYIPLPICLALFESETIAVLFAYILGVELASWTLGILILQGRLSRELVSKLLSPPILSIVAATGLNMFGIDSFIPVWILRTLEMLGVIAFPLALLLSGAFLADFATRDNLASDKRVVILSIATRNFLLPLIFLGILAIVPQYNVHLTRVLIVEAAMPSGIFLIIMSRIYGGHVPTALKVALATSAIGLLTIPFWLEMGLRWILKLQGL